MNQRRQKRTITTLSPNKLERLKQLKQIELRKKRNQPQTTARTSNRFTFTSPLSPPPLIQSTPGTRKIGKKIKTFFGKETIPIFPGVNINLGKAKTQFRSEGLPGKVVAELIPRNRAEASLLVGGGYLFGKAPAFLRIGAGTGIAAMEAPIAFNNKLPKEQRIAAGIVGTLGASGAMFESVPFIRGARNRFRTDFTPVTTQAEGFKGINTPDRIGLILPNAPGKTGATSTVNLPAGSPLVKGGFGRQRGVEQQFLGKNQPLATSQINLFKPGKNIPIEREFFVTPAEPTLGIAETRVSRLGLTNPFELPKNTKISFGIPGQPQVGVTIGSVKAVETPRDFYLGKGSELEAIKSTGIITNVRETGVTSIKGQGVKLFSFDVTPGLKPGKFIPPRVTTGSTSRGSTVSGESTLSVTGVIRESPGVSTTLRTSTTSSIPASTFTIPRTVDFRTGTPTTKFPASRGGGGGRRPPSITFKPTAPTLPKSPPITPPRTPTITTRTPPLTSFLSPPKSLPRSPAFTPNIPKTASRKFFSFSGRTARASTGRFPVSLRRFGTFKVIGYGGTQRQAFNIGRRAASTTLGATFKVGGGGRQPSFVKGFRRKKTDEGNLFIELPKFRLSKSSEIKEIQAFRRNK